MLDFRNKFLHILLPLLTILALRASAARTPLEDIQAAYSAAETALAGRAQALLVACRLYDLGQAEAAARVYGGTLDPVVRRAAQQSAEGMLSSIDGLREMLGRSVAILHLPDAERTEAAARHVGYLWQSYASDRALMYARTTCEEPYIASSSPTVAELERYLDPSRYSDQAQRAQAGRYFLNVLLKTFMGMMPREKLGQTPLDLLGGSAEAVADASMLSNEESLRLFLTIVVNSMRTPLAESLAADKKLGEYLLGKRSIFPPAADDFVLVGRDERGRQTPQTELADEFTALKLWLYGKSVIVDRFLGTTPTKKSVAEFLRTNPQESAWDILIGNWFVTRGSLKRFGKHPLYKPSSAEYRSLEVLVRGAARHSEAQVLRAGAFLRGEVATLELPAAPSRSVPAPVPSAGKKKAKAAGGAGAVDPRYATGGGAHRGSEVAATTTDRAVAAHEAPTAHASSAVDAVAHAARLEALAREEAIAAERQAAERAIRAQIDEVNRRLSEERRSRRDTDRASRLLTATLMSSSARAEDHGATEEDAASSTTVAGVVASATGAMATAGLPLLTDASAAIQSFAHIVSTRGLATRDHIRDALEALARSYEGFALAEGAGSRINVQHRAFGSLTLHLPHNGMVSTDAGATRSPYRIIFEALYGDFR